MRRSRTSGTTTACRRVRTAPGCRTTRSPNQERAAGSLRLALRALIAHACAALISCVAQIWRGTSTVFRVHALALIAVGWFCVWLCAPARLHFVHDSSTIEIVFGVIFPLTCVPPRSLRHASPGCLGHRRAAMLDSR